MLGTVAAILDRMRFDSSFDRPSLRVPCAWVPRRAAQVAATCLLATLGWLGSGCDDDVASGSQREEAATEAYRPDILVIVVDTLRRDHLGAYGYDRRTSPNIDALASRGVRFERATSQAPWTTPSVGALMTSRYPVQLGIRDFESPLPLEIQTLAETLDDAGYATAAVISHFFINSRWNFDQGFDIFDEENILGHQGISSPGVTDRAIELFDKVFDRAPGFLFVHYFDPHYAYIEHPRYPFSPGLQYEGWIRSGTPFHEIRAKQEELTEADADYMRALYDSEIAFTDFHIGRLLNELRRRRKLDDMLVVFTADHGEAFLDHDHVGHTSNVYEELVHVPLIMKWPQQRQGSVESRRVQLVDVYPTILGHLGMRRSTGLMGTVIGGPDWPQPVLTETVRWNELRAIYDGRFKLIHDLKTDASELYDLEADPEELNDLAAQRPTRRDEMRSALKARFDRLEEQGTAVEEDVDLTADDHARLEALGYVE